MPTQTWQVRVLILASPPPCSSLCSCTTLGGSPHLTSSKAASSSSCLTILWWHLCSFFCIDFLYSVPTNPVSISGLCNLCSVLVSASEVNCSWGQRLILSKSCWFGWWQSGCFFRIGRGKWNPRQNGGLGFTVILQRQSSLKYRIKLTSYGIRLSWVWIQTSSLLSTLLSWVGYIISLCFPFYHL